MKREYFAVFLVVLGLGCGGAATPGFDPNPAQVLPSNQLEKQEAGSQSRNEVDTLPEGSTDSPETPEASVTQPQAEASAPDGASARDAGIEPIVPPVDSGADAPAKADGGLLDATSGSDICPLVIPLHCGAGAFDVSDPHSSAQGPCTAYTPACPHGWYCFGADPSKAAICP